MKRYYEIVFILNVNLDGAQQENILNRVKERLQSDNGDVYSLQDMGKKRMTYLIDKEKYGQYFVLKYGVEKPFVSEMNRWMELNNNIMAYIQIRIENEPERIEGFTNYKQNQERATPVVVNNKRKKDSDSETEISKEETE